MRDAPGGCHEISPDAVGRARDIWLGKASGVLYEPGKAPVCRSPFVADPEMHAE